MAFNLLFEFTGSVDWTELHRLACSRQRVVEWFPVPASTPGEPDGLAASVPLKHAGDAAWLELHESLRAITAAFPASVINLYTGTAVPESEWHTIREYLRS